MDLTTSDAMVRAWASTPSTWTATGLHLVHLDAIDWDPDGAFNPAGTGGLGGYAYTAPTDGYYLLIGRIGVDGTAAGDSFIGHIQANGNDVVRGTKMTLTADDVANATTALVSHAADIRFLHQGDQIQLYAELLVSAAPGLTLITDNTRTYLTAIRLL